MAMDPLEDAGMQLVFGDGVRVMAGKTLASKILIETGIDSQPVLVFVAVTVYVPMTNPVKLLPVNASVVVIAPPTYHLNV